MKNDRDDNVEYVPADDRIIGTFFRRSLIVIGAVAVIAVVVWLLTRGDDGGAVATIERDIEGPAVLDQSSATMPQVAWTDVTANAGIDFVHVNGADGGKLLPETMGAGAAFFDLEGDGDQDLEASYLQRSPIPMISV